MTGAHRDLIFGQNLTKIGQIDLWPKVQLWSNWELNLKKLSEFWELYLRFFKRSARRSEGRKKTQEKGQRGEISKIREEEEKRKHRSALRALRKCVTTT